MVDSIEHKTAQAVSFELENSSSNSVAHMEEHVKELDYSHKTMLKLFSDLSDDFRATIVETIKTKMVEMKVQVNLTMWALANQISNEACIASWKFKILKPKAFNGNLDAKEFENFIFDMEQYFKASGTNFEETKVTLAFMHMFDDAKL